MKTGMQKLEGRRQMPARRNFNPPLRASLKNHFKVGHATIRIETRGCVQCGTWFSSGWMVARELVLSINGFSPIAVQVHICADCNAKVKPLPQRSRINPELMEAAI